MHYYDDYYYSHRITTMQSTAMAVVPKKELKLIKVKK